MYLTVKEVAERFRVTQASVYIAVKEGRLRSERKFGRIVISDRDADAYGGTVGLKNGYAKRARSGA